MSYTLAMAVLHTGRKGAGTCYETVLQFAKTLGATFPRIRPMPSLTLLVDSGRPHESDLGVPTF